MSRPIRSAAVILAIVGAAANAVAGDKDEAKTHFLAGKALMESEDFNGAALELEKSVALYPTKGNLSNLAQCYKALNRRKDALETFERAKLEFGSSYSKQDLKAIEAGIDEMNAFLGRVSVTSKPSGASVAIDGNAMGATPLGAPIILTPGPHQILVSLDKHESETRVIEVAARDLKTVSFELKEAKASLMVVSNQAGAEISVDGTAVGETPLDAPIALDKGTHKVVLALAGFETEEQTVEMDLGNETSIDFDLKPEAPAATPVSSEPLAATETRAPADQGAGKGKPLGNALFFTGLAGTVLAGGATVAMWVVMGKKKDDYVAHNDRLSEEWDADLAKTTKDDQDATITFNRVAVITTAVTVAFAAVMVSGIVVKKKQSGKETTTAVSFAPGGVSVEF